MTAAVAVLFQEPKDWANNIGCQGRSATVSDAALTALSVLSHDLRGPLANLSLLLESIAEANEHAALDRVATYVTRAERALERMEGMLRGMIGRVSAAGGPFGINRQPVDLFALADDVVRNNLALARRTGVRLDVRGSVGTVVMADADLLIHAVENLVNNAIRHSPTGGVVCCEVGIAPAETCIVVRDDGPGLKPDMVDKLFKPFPASAMARGSFRSSVGLGLWIVSAVVERHGGTVAGTNRADRQGAQFTIRLPNAANRQA
jgi:two-component system, OmpR family, sensor histidine kinase SenX3